MKKLVIIGSCVAVILPAFSQEKLKMTNDIEIMHNQKHALFCNNHIIPACPIVDENIDKGGNKNELVARKDYDVSKDWQPRKIMGKDFWYLLQNDRSEPDFFIDSGRSDMRELEEKPLFKESGVLYWNESITVPGFNKVSISAMTPNIFLKLMEKRPNAPFFIMPSCVRPILGLMKNFEHDIDTYNTWKHTHPNFMGCINAETDNDFLHAVPWRMTGWERIKARLNKTGDKELIETIVREFPKPQNREEFTLQFLKGCEANRKYFFNDNGKVDYLRASYCLDHYFFESGSDAVALETTNTAGGEGGPNYRHQVSLFFTRGAAHQYKKNWMWYIAFYYNGYDDQGKFSGNNYANYRITEAVESPSSGSNNGKQGPDCGMSPSLIARSMFLSYLSGASFVCTEQWWDYLHETEKDGRPMWDLSSPYGKVWEDWFEFTRKNPDRGTSFAPVALLVPFTQGYPNYGGESWGVFNYERHDWMIDAFMFTIMPHSPVTKKGDEGALANSPYGDIYDVIVPNTPNKPVSIDVLNNYKVAIMLGKYPKSKALAERLMEYVKYGGTLLLNIKQVNEFFQATFLGLERGNDEYTFRVKTPVRSLHDDKKFDLLENYQSEAVKLKGATPLLEDADGNVLAYKNSFGKGNVIVSTVDCMVPDGNADGKDENLLGKMVYGKKFPFVEYFLKTIVSEVLPLEVKGDIEYGLNKLSDGWLLYLINNRGVTKFTNKEQVLDISKTTEIEVFLRDIKALKITELRKHRAVSKDNKSNSFTVDVPPGDIIVVKIEEKD